MKTLIALICANALFFIGTIVSNELQFRSPDPSASLAGDIKFGCFLAFIATWIAAAIVSRKHLTKWSMGNVMIVGWLVLSGSYLIWVVMSMVGFLLIGVF